MSPGTCIRQTMADSYSLAMIRIHTPRLGQGMFCWSRSMPLALLSGRELTIMSTPRRGGGTSLGDGGYIVAGYTGGPVFDLGLTNNATELLIFKVDASGNVLWRRLLSDDTLTTGYGSMSMRAGASLSRAAWAVLSRGPGALLLRFDPEGNELWRRRFELGDALIPWGVIHCADGGYALVAHVNGPDASARRRDVCVIKTDADGEEEWTFVGGDDLGLAGDRVGRGIVQTRDGGYAITGGASTRNAGDLFVAKLDSGGGLSWVTRPRGALDTDGYDLLEAEDGSLIASGASYVAGGFQSCMHFYAARFSASGAVQWTGRFAGGAWDAATTVGQRADGTFLLAGYTAPDVFAPFSIYLITTDASTSSRGTVARARESRYPNKD